MAHRGQALVETVVWLPVLVLVFLSLFYLKGLVDTKMAAVEAARYVSWEQAWWVREGLSPERSYKSDDDLKGELQALGLGQPKTVKKITESLPTYVGRVAGEDAAEASVEIPAFIQAILGGGGGNEVGSGFTSPPGDSANTGGAQAGTNSGQLDSQSGTNDDGQSFNTSGDSSLALPSEANDLINGLLDVIGEGAFQAHGFFARQTAWGEEDVNSVVSVQVTYAYAPQGSRWFPPVDVSQTASLLSHPFNIKRSNDDTEYERLVGGSGFDCFTDPAHIVDLWLYPSGPFAEGDVAAGVSTALRAGKCVFASLGSVLSFLEFIVSDIGYHVPAGTLKEYPELDAPRDGATTGLGPSNP